MSCHRQSTFSNLVIKFSQRRLGSERLMGRFSVFPGNWPKMPVLSPKMQRPARHKGPFRLFSTKHGRDRSLPSEAKGKGKWKGMFKGMGCGTVGRGGWVNLRMS